LLSHCSILRLRLEALTMEARKNVVKIVKEEIYQLNQQVVWWKMEVSYWVCFML
jgi:ribosome recycling factor